MHTDTSDRILAVVGLVIVVIAAFAVAVNAVFLEGDNTAPMLLMILGNILMIASDSTEILENQEKVLVNQQRIMEHLGIEENPHRKKESVR